MALGKSLTVLPVTQTSSNIRTEIEGILAKKKNKQSSMFEVGRGPIGSGSSTAE